LETEQSASKQNNQTNLPLTRGPGGKGNSKNKDSDLSAKEWPGGKDYGNITEIWPAIDEALENRSKIIDRAKLRTLFNYLMKKKPPKKLALKKKPVVYDLLFTRSSPPTFELLVKDPETIHWSYVRFLENLVRKQFNLHATGVVVKLTPVSRKQVLS
jgi:predicted GTPase